MSKKLLLFGFAALLSIIFLAGCCAAEPGFGLAAVEEIDILIAESFPVQVFVVAEGYLPDPCTEIYEVTQEREGNNFFVTIKIHRSPGACIQVIQPFEETISLNVYGLSAGTYNVDVNGVQDSFSLPMDNFLILQKNDLNSPANFVTIRTGSQMAPRLINYHIIIQEEFDFNEHVKKWLLGDIIFSKDKSIK